MKVKRRGMFAAMIGGLSVAALVAAVWFNARDTLPRALAGESVEFAGPEPADADPAPPIEWRSDYRAALVEAEVAGKTVVIDFYATWCAPCKLMEQTTFTDPRVRRRMTRFIPLKVDVDQQQQIARLYGISGLPTTAVVAAVGRPLTSAIGYLDADRFLELLDSAPQDPDADSVTEIAAPANLNDAAPIVTGPDPAPLPRLGIIGRPAPELGVTTWFNLPDDRESADVTDYRGKVVYLYGFQSWCPGCHRYGFPTLTTLIDHYLNDPRVVFLAVQTTFEGFSTNTPEKAKQTADRYGLTIPVGHSGSPGRPSTLMRRYRTGGTPWTVLIDPDGVVRFNDFHIAPDKAIDLIDRMLADDA